MGLFAKMAKTIKSLRKNIDHSVKLTHSLHHIGVYSSQKIKKNFNQQKQVSTERAIASKLYFAPPNHQEI